MERYTVSGSRAHCKCVGYASGGSTPSLSTIFGQVAKRLGSELLTRQCGNHSHAGSNPVLPARPIILKSFPVGVVMENLSRAVMV